MLFALVYLLARRVVRLAAGSASQSHNDIEIVVLRHQLAVLKRQVGRPRVRRQDRLFMAALGQVLPRPRWSSFVVSPQTLLRWHRELVRRKCSLCRRRHNVHLLRNSFRYASRRDWAAVAKDLRPSYTAATEAAARKDWRRSPPPGRPATQPSSSCGSTPGPSSSPSWPSIWRSAP
jgi:Transposase, Mutator family